MYSQESFSIEPLDLSNLPTYSHSPWTHPNWLEFTKRKTERNLLSLKNSEQLIIIRYSNSDIVQYSSLISFLLAKQDVLRIVDFGGGMGQTVPAALIHLPRSHLDRVEYHVIDSPIQCALGKSIFDKNQFEFVHFHPGIAAFDQANSARRVDIVYSFYTMPYISTWQEVWSQLLRYEPTYFIFGYCVVSQLDFPFAVIQHIVSPLGYCGDDNYIIIPLQDFIKFFQAKNYHLLFNKSVELSSSLQKISPISFIKNTESYSAIIQSRTLIFSKK